MFLGTTIEDLMNIVERAEEHARETESPMVTAHSGEMLPGFMYEVTNQQVWYGVA